MSSEIIVKKYSQALFEATEINNKTEIIANELNQLVKVFSQNQSLEFFNSPYNSYDNKIMVAKSALEGKCSPETFNFLITIVEKNRLSYLSLINDSFQAMVRSKSGETEGELYVANEITGAFKLQVETKLAQCLNKKVKLVVKNDSTLISGYKVVVGGWTMDDSAQFHLNKIKENISKRGI